MIFKSLFAPHLDKEGLADIQGLILRLYRLPYGKYLFLNFSNAEQGRAWLDFMRERVTSAARWDQEGSATLFTWNVAFSAPGLRALGLPATALDSFSAEFKQGMVARAAMLGDTGTCAPNTWDGPFGDAEAVHAMLILFATDTEVLQAQEDWQRELITRYDGVNIVYEQDGQMLPGQREHFGFRDGIGQPAIENSGLPVLPGQDEVKTGEFILGYPDETGNLPPQPEPEELGRHGSYVVLRKLQQNVAAFREFIHQKAVELGMDDELMAAKIMGRWRSGAPLARAPHQDDPDLGADPLRNNDFKFREEDPEGLFVPHGSHVRRSYARDAQPEKIAIAKRHRVMRGGMPYGPPLPEGAPDDGQDRGLLFVFFGASIERQFEFVQSVWINDGDFANLGADRDPVAGANDEPTELIIPQEPLRKHVKGIPRFAYTRGGGYFFMPSLTALEYLACGEWQQE